MNFSSKNYLVFLNNVYLNFPIRAPFLKKCILKSLLAKSPFPWNKLYFKQIIHWPVYQFVSKANLTSVRLKTRKTRLAKLIILCSYPCSQLCSSLLFYQFAEEEREKWLKIFSPSVLSFLGTRHWSLCGLRDTLNNDSKYWRQKLRKFYDYTTFPMRLWIKQKPR